MDEDPITQELRVDQLRRERAERDQADEAPTDEAVEQHERRAEKAAYLRERLEERADAERRAAREGEPAGAERRTPRGGDAEEGAPQT